MDQHGHAWRISSVGGATCECHGYIGWVVSAADAPIKIQMFYCRECPSPANPATSIALGQGARCVLHGG